MIHHFIVIKLLSSSLCIALLSSSSFIYNIQFNHFKHLHHYHLYGNELTVANHYFNLTSNFKQSDYFKDFDDCPSTYLKCFRNVNSHYRETIRLWNQPIIDKFEKFPRRVKDCSYDIQLIDVKNISSIALIYIFTVRNLCCTSKSKIRGGSTFDVFGYTDHDLTSCQTFDMFESSSAHLSIIQMMKTLVMT